jgi:putative NADPH-quinone reductase
MLISLLVANPKPKSFCHALALAAASACRGLGHEVRFHDLYLEAFNPVLDEQELRKRRSDSALVEDHCREAADADAFIIVHPNWWGQPPAILKGWVDRVLRADVAYRFSEGDAGTGIPRGLLKARTAIVLNTSDTPMAREREVFGDPLDTLWGKCIFRYCGVPAFVHHTYSVVANSDVEERRGWIEHAQALVRGALAP